MRSKNKDSIEGGNFKRSGFEKVADRVTLYSIQVKKRLRIVQNDENQWQLVRELFSRFSRPRYRSERIATWNISGYYNFFAII